MGLGEKEKLFCCFYHQIRNAREAAVRAGFENPEQAAEGMMQDAEIRREQKRLQRQASDFGGEVEAGYRRAAFGSVTDAVKLLYLGENPDAAQLEQMDLFSISEIKYQKEKGIEIKFFDRLRALEKLEELHRSASGNDASAFYKALEEGARKLTAKKETD